MADRENTSDPTPNHDNTGTPGDQSGTSPWLTVADACADLRVARSTWDGWHAVGRTPRMHRLPNGQYRIRRTAYDAWLDSLETEPPGGAE